MVVNRFLFMLFLRRMFDINRNNGMVSRMNLFSVDRIVCGVINGEKLFVRSNINLSLLRVKVIGIWIKSRVNSVVRIRIVVNGLFYLLEYCCG